MTTQMTAPFAQSLASARLVPTSGRSLPLSSANISARAAAGLAEVRFTQVFENVHAEPLSVTYKLPLPADAAVGGYLFRVGEETFVGKVEKKADARDQFERAVLEGKSASLLEEERTSVFTQEIGNIPPHTQVTIEVTLDMPLKYLAGSGGGAWELRFPLTVAPRYLGTGSDQAGVSVDVASGPISARASLSLTVADELSAGRSPESPSHPLQVRVVGKSHLVELGSDNRIELDRDVVVRWPVAEAFPRVSLDLGRASSGGRYHALCTVVPPTASAAPTSMPRDVTLLIDTSGSMSGTPLAQAQRVASAIVENLGDSDVFELIEFGSHAIAYRNTSTVATRAEKAAAIAWIQRLTARGGTEMLTGVKAALASSSYSAQRQIVLITDGLIGFERDIVCALLAGLPRSSRFHALGVGDSANRSLLAPVARAGRGIEAIIGLGEDAEPAAVRLLGRMNQPLVVDLVLDGEAGVRTSSAHLPDLFAGSPAKILLELEPSALGREITLRGRMQGSAFVRTIRVPANVSEESSGLSLSRLFARDQVEELEMKQMSGEDPREIEKQIEQIGLTHQISTRLTSFVAVSDRPMVDAQSPTRRETMPNTLAHGMSAEALGLRPAGSAAYAQPMYAMAEAAAPRGMLGGAPPPPAAMAPPASRSRAAAPGAPPPMQDRPLPPAPAAPRRMAMPQAPVRKEVDALEKSKKSAERVDQSVIRDQMPEAAPKGAATNAPIHPKLSLDDSPPAELADERAYRSIALRSFIDGVITYAKGKLLVLEFVLTEPLQFDLAECELSVFDAERGKIVAALDPSKSTRAGDYGVGVTLRITIDLANEEADQVDRVLVRLANGQVTLRAVRS